MRELFHPGGVIEITWFDGLFSDFVDASAGMAASDLRTKHLIGSPLITFNGHRALVETNAMIVEENVRLALGCTTHNRFYDRVERRGGAWKIVNRQSIYDMASFSFPTGVLKLEQDLIGRYPREYAALAYLLQKSGFPVTRVFATKGSALEREMKASAAAWLLDRKEPADDLVDRMRAGLLHVAATQPSTASRPATS